MAVNAARRIPAAVAAFWAVAVLAAAVSGEGDARGGWLSDADRAAFERVRVRRGRRGAAVARVVSALAEPEAIYPVLAVAGVSAARRDGWPRACWPCLVVATGAAARTRLSRVIARQRPPADAWLAEPEGFSLPSRHTALAAMTAGACVGALGIRGAPGRTAPVLAAAPVGASRVYLGVHWPADVIAGWLFAEGWLRLVGLGNSANPNRRGREPLPLGQALREPNCGIARILKPADAEVTTLSSHLLGHRSLTLGHS